MALQFSQPTPLIQQVQTALHESLHGMGLLGQCALLHYPYYPNIGDHLIGLGTVQYLTNVAGATLSYIATARDFRPTALEAQIGQGPILLSGGGNLGDLWPKEQQFREAMIERYHDRPIISLPQSIYFADPENAAHAARIFNAHPNLTLFVRETASYHLALQYFPRCRVIQAPDMAFQLSSLPALPFAPSTNQNILYHCRQDIEYPASFAVDSQLAALAQQDWQAYEWHYRWHLPGVASFVRELWQRRLAVPQEWLSRWLWCGAAQRFQAWPAFTNRYGSGALVHSGMYQFLRHRALITNRLHGHILAVLLGIPHIFLPNAYHKNESFYRTWTHIFPFCQFVQDPAQVCPALEQLLSSEL